MKKIILVSFALLVGNDAFTMIVPKDVSSELVTLDVLERRCEKAFDCSSKAELKVYKALQPYPLLYGRYCEAQEASDDNKKDAESKFLDELGENKYELYYSNLLSLYRVAQRAKSDYQRAQRAVSDFEREQEVLFNGLIGSTPNVVRQERSQAVGSRRLEFMQEFCGLASNAFTEMGTLNARLDRLSAQQAEAEESLERSFSALREMSKVDPELEKTIADILASKDTQ